MGRKIDKEKLRASLNAIEKALRIKIGVDKIVDDVSKLSPAELDDELRRAGINPDTICAISEAITSTKH